jgi:hypothetical protein
VSPSGDRAPIEIGTAPVWIPFERAGFYQIEELDASGEPLTVAVNPALAESDLAPVAPERIVESVVGAPGAMGQGGTATEIETGPVRRELWWWILVLAAVVLAAESIVANRWTRRRPASGLASSA